MNEQESKISWLSDAGLDITIDNNHRPLKSLGHLLYIVFRLHSELGSDRKVRFQIEVLE